jgi:hypothetical protein
MFRYVNDPPLSFLSRTIMFGQVGKQFNSIEQLLRRDV